LTSKTSKLPQHGFPFSAFSLSLLATLLVLAEGFVWTAQQSMFAVQFNAEDLLFHFGPAALMTLCTVLLLRRPIHNKLLGVGIGFSAVLSLLAGGGFLAGLVLGLAAAVLAVAWNSKRRIVSPLQNRFMKFGRKNRAVMLLAVAVIAVIIVLPLN
jgi:hypothetical protein